MLVWQIVHYPSPRSPNGHFKVLRVPSCGTFRQVIIFGNFNEGFASLLTRLVHQGFEEARLFDQLVRMPELDDSSRIHDQDFVAVHHRVEPVGDGQHRAAGKVVPYGSLNQFIGLWIHIGCRLVQNQNSVVA